MSNNKKSKPEILDEVLLGDLPAEVEETVETPQEIADEIIEAAVIETFAKAGTYIVLEGDTYAALGKKFVKSGETPFQAAQRISGLNGGKTLAAGTVVNL